MARHIKNRHAVELGRLRWKKFAGTTGSHQRRVTMAALAHKRARALTPKERSDIAREGGYAKGRG